MAILKKTKNEVIKAMFIVKSIEKRRGQGLTKLLGLEETLDRLANEA